MVRVGYLEILVQGVILEVTQNIGILDMTKEQERLFCKAMTKTLRAYENVIVGYIPGGEGQVCNLFSGDCDNCPLNECGPGVVAFANLKDKYVKAARARYRWLIAKIKKAGYTYE
jgi:hypothetical protein